MPNRQQAIIWTSDGPRYWPIHASLGVDDLKVGNKVYKTDINPMSSQYRW